MISRESLLLLDGPFHIVTMRVLPASARATEPFVEEFLVLRLQVGRLADPPDGQDSRITAHSCLSLFCVTG